MKALIILLAGCVLIFVGTGGSRILADDIVRHEIVSNTIVNNTIAGGSGHDVSSALPISYDFTEKDRGYEESPLRRFEIVFFISIPVSLLITFLGIEGYRVLSGQIGGFTPVEYQYMIFSTLGISLGVALKDQQAVFLKERF
ncbi:MAG TPA: hypothetical protein VMZ05_07610 [Spirochaetota bacterium]|nr:hypothetical protein [Spirochaetota bacterium]